MPGFRRAAVRCTLTMLLSCAGLASAQQPGTTDDLPPQDHTYTLHVYADLLQVATLVLDEHGSPAPDMTAASFQLQLDSGPIFHPTAVHPEGKDPLSLAVVIDGSGAEKELVSTLATTPGHGLPSTLLPHDHVSVYAFDCRGLRSSNDEPAELALKRSGVAELLANPSLHRPDAPTKTCRNTKHVWDMLAYAASELAEKPGRRAMLLISDGDDRGSKVTLDALLHYAAGRSISIFVLRQADFSPSAAFGRRPSMPSPATQLQEALDTLSMSTGGVVLVTDQHRLAAELDHFVTLLRSRYILQFPRPANEQAGNHRIEVRVANRTATVLTAGTSAPLRDAALMNDPNTVPADTSKMPVLGTHKPPR